MNAAILIAVAASVIALAAFPTGHFSLTISVVAVALSACLAACACFPRAPRQPRSRWVRPSWVEWTCIATLLFILVTLIPLPLPATAVTGARRHGQNARVAEAIQAAADHGLLRTGSPWFALTRNRAGSLRVGLMLIAMFATAQLVSRLTPSSKTGLLRFLSVTVAAIGVAGHIGQWHVPQGYRIWWLLEIPPDPPGPVACFVNRNHFAALLVAFCPAAIALLDADVARRRWTRAVLSATTFACLAFAAVLVLSRGAFISLAAAMAATVLVLLARRRYAAAVLLAAAAVVLGGCLLARPAVRARVATFSEITTSDSYLTRLNAWRDSIPLWRAYPLAGAGLNGFRMTYPQHRQTSDSALMTHTENEYVQLLADTGVIGVALFLAICLALAREAVLPGLRRRGDAVFAVAGIGALTAAAASAAFDYTMHIPMYGIPVAALVGTMLTQRARAEPGDESACVRASPLPAWVNLAAAVAIALPWHAKTRLDSPAFMRTATLEARAEALAWAPTSQQAWYFFARKVYRVGGASAAALAERCMTQSVVYDPNNYKRWLKVGQFRLDIGEHGLAREAFARVRELRYWVTVPAVPGESTP